MIKWLRRLWQGPPRKPDPVAFMESLGEWEIDEAYTKVDRYRDFRKVFMQSQEGRRVLSQIMQMTHLYAPSVSETEAVGGATNPNLTYFREGERNIGLAIMTILNAEPE